MECVYHDSELNKLNKFLRDNLSKMKNVNIHLGTVDYKPKNKIFNFLFTITEDNNIIFNNSKFKLCKSYNHPIIIIYYISLSNIGANIYSTD